MLWKISKIADIFNRLRTIAVEDSALIHGLKKKYTHSVREFYHGNNRYFADCIYCHAVPGTIETSLILLGDRLKTSNGNNRLLNLGGGTGQISKILTEIGFDVVSVDIELKDDDPKNVKFDLNSEHELPFEPEYFDFIFCQEVIEHIENPWKLFRNMRRVLKSKGLLLLTTPNIQSNYSKKIFDKDGYFHWFTPDCFGYHVNPLPLWEIELIAERNAFIVKTVKGNGEYYFKTNQHNKQGLIHNNECLIFVMEKKH